jgi:hypothetical protein
MAAELLLVQLEFLLKSGHFINHFSLAIFQLLDNCLASALLLVKSKLEILALCIQNLS